MSLGVNEEMIDKQAAEAAQRRLDMSTAYKTCLLNDHGKKVLQDLSAKCYINRTTYEKGSSPYDMAFNEGMRKVACHIIGMLDLDTSELMGQVKEANNKLEKEIIREGSHINTDDLSGF